MTGTNGYLASVVTMRSGCGSPRCPWLIETQPGQLVNITLMNYFGTRGPPYDIQQQSGERTLLLSCASLWGEHEVDFDMIYIYIYIYYSFIYIYVCVCVCVYVLYILTL